MQIICRYCGYDLTCKRCCYRWRNRQSTPHLPFCFRCSGWGYERFHSCCRVTDLVSGPDLYGRLRYVLSRPDASGDERSVTVRSTSTITDPVTGIAARPVFADHYLPASSEYDDEVYSLFPLDHQDPTLGFAQLLSVTVSEVCETYTAVADRLQVLVGPGTHVSVSTATIVLRTDVRHLLVERYFLGSFFP